MVFTTTDTNVFSLFRICIERLLYFHIHIIALIINKNKKKTVQTFFSVLNFYFKHYASLRLSEIENVYIDHNTCPLVSLNLCL